MSNGWSILHTQCVEDIPMALERTKVDVILLSRCSAFPGWERAAWSACAQHRDIPILALGSIESQDALVRALLGLSPLASPCGAGASWGDGGGTGPPEGAGGDLCRSALTPTLFLFTPTDLHVTEGIQRALEFIDAHYSEPISLADAARAAFYSRCHFCKLFKEQLGISFVRYLWRVRIRHALELLTRSHLPITEIALELGFNDLSHFERVFRTIQRESPSQFRRNAQRGLSKTKDLSSHSQNAPSQQLLLTSS
jgi:AraC-like DNA-binding protein